MSYGNCLAGGVVFGAMMLHVLPCICTPTIVNNTIIRSYPIGLFFASISFLLLFAIDRIFLRHNETRNNDRESLIEREHEILEDGDMVTSIYRCQNSFNYNKNTVFIFVFALSLHSFLEGLGLASMFSESEVISYIIGLISHKWLEAFALGLSVYQARLNSFMQTCLIFTYASLTPIGILLGMSLVGEVGDLYAESGARQVSKIFSGLSVGSFMYVTFIEMIPPEFEVLDHTSKYKFSCVVAGFFVMALFAWIEII